MSVAEGADAALSANMLIGSATETLYPSALLQMRQRHTHTHAHTHTNKQTDDLPTVISLVVCACIRSRVYVRLIGTDGVVGMLLSFTYLM